MDEKRQSEIEALLTTEGLWSANNATIRNAIRDLLAEIAALTPDALLGAAVRELPQNSTLRHEHYRDSMQNKHSGWGVAPLGSMGGSSGYGTTPEAALKAAGLMDD